MKYWLIFFVLLLSLNGCKKQQTGSLGTVELETTKTFPPINPLRYNVGFLIMDGTYNTEFTAPFDIFQHTIYRDSIKAMNVFTVANTDDPITTFEGVRIIPDYNYLSDESPKIDILVIPSG